MADALTIPEEADAARALAREIASLPEGMPKSSKRGFVALQPRLFES